MAVGLTVDRLLNFFDWQTVVALLVVGLSTAVLIRHAYRFFVGSAQSGCAGCSGGGCGAKSKRIGDSGMVKTQIGQSLPIIQLGAPPKRP